MKCANCITFSPLFPLDYIAFVFVTGTTYVIFILMQTEQKR